MREGNFLERKFPLDPFKELFAEKFFGKGGGCAGCVSYDKAILFSEEKTGRTATATDLFYFMAGARFPKPR